MTEINTLKRQTANCLSHGEYASTQFGRRWTGCPTCAEGQGVTEHQDQAQRKALEARLALTGIPPMYLRATLDQTEHAPAVRRWLALPKDQPASLLLLGTLGTGKTYLACALVREAVGLGYYARYDSTASYLRRIRASWDGRGNEAKIFEDAAAAQILVLDDVGASRRVDNDAWRIHELIDERYVRGNPTVLVSNLTPPDLKVELGDRTYDRVRHGATTVSLVGTSRRNPH